MNAGLEDIDDLIGDMGWALHALFAPTPKINEEW